MMLTLLMRPGKDKAIQSTIQYFVGSCNKEVVLVQIREKENERVADRCEQQNSYPTRRRKKKKSVHCTALASSQMALHSHYVDGAEVAVKKSRCCSSFGRKRRSRRRRSQRLEQSVLS